MTELDDAAAWQSRPTAAPTGGPRQTLEAQTKPRTHDRERFQHWLAHMDDALRRFIAALPAADQQRLDGTPESLDHLESLLLARYASPAAAKDASQAHFLDGAARYFGEILRQGSGATWRIELDDKSSVFHGLPVLFGGGIRTVPICPLTSMTALLDRRTGTFLSSTCARLQLRPNTRSQLP